MTGDLVLYCAETLTAQEIASYLRMYKRKRFLSKVKETADERSASISFFGKISKMYREKDGWSKVFVSTVAFGTTAARPDDPIFKILGFSPDIVNDVIEIFGMGSITAVTGDVISRVEKAFDECGKKTESSWDRIAEKDAVIGFLKHVEGKQVFLVIH